MKKFDFDRVIDRTGTDSYKWDMRKALFDRDDVLPMWVADMDFAAPEEVIQALVDRAQHGVFGYLAPTERYHQTFKDWLKLRHEWDVNLDWVMNAPGVVPSIAFAIEALTDPGDRILIHSPVYYPFFSVIQSNGREVVTSRLIEANRQYRIDFEDMERKFKSGVSVLLLCSPHNPAGRVWTRTELEQMHNLCEKYNVFVLSDEIHADVVYKPHKHIPYASLNESAAQQSITFMAPSKTFNLAGLHHSLMIIPDDRILRKLKNRINRLVLSSINNFSLTASETAYRHGADWLDALLLYLSDNIRLAIETFEDVKGITPFEPEGTYLLWLDCRALNLPHRELIHWMKHEAKVGLNDGAVFGPGGEGFLRMNLACPRVIVQEGLDRITEAVNRIVK